MSFSKRVGQALVLFIMIVVVVAVVRNQNNPKTAQPAAAQPDVFAVDIKNEFFRNIYAKDELKKIARDPDSVVVEYTTKAQPTVYNHFAGRVDGTEGFVFDVGYRAKNGFGGYTRDVRTLSCDTNGYNVQFVDPFSITHQVDKGALKNKKIKGDH